MHGVEETVQEDSGGKTWAPITIIAVNVPAVLGLCIVCQIASLCYTVMRSHANDHCTIIIILSHYNNA